MSDNSKNDDFLTIRLDDEDRRDYQKNKQTPSKPTSTNSSPSQPTSSSSRSGFPVIGSLALLIALASSGAGYYLYQLTESQASIITSAENRISILENKLSATDEEIGESTVALQVKVTDLSKTTNELWEQMDKLWASAWRRNQKEIADLSARVTNVQNGLQESITQVSRTTETQRTQLGAVDSQLSSLANELLALNVQLEQTIESKNDALQTNETLQQQLADIEQRNEALLDRMTQFEKEIKAMATQLVSPAVL